MCVHYIMNNIEKVFQHGYIDESELNNISNVNKQYIINNWTHVKNKHTQKTYYLVPCNSSNSKNKLRFDLLKVVCEHQPETFEEKLMKELNIN